ncbi:hypothetical protein [uncultured Clostridium sp.]|uniref:hypothetical protein n=1 Tax=uncultured Clostridium sp. TaxID=59620 RepID=UPI0025D732E2|nr:hypothetical protein [uncultured Clostridium sp.]
MYFLLGVLISIVTIVMFYYYIYKMLETGNVIYMLKELKAKEWITIISIFIFSVAISSILLQRNKYIYYWDYCMHWGPAISMSNMIFNNPIEMLKNIAGTISTSDYNWSMPLLYAPLVSIFGKEYSTVMIIVQIFFLCPTYVVISLYINKFISILGYGKKSVSLYVALVAMIPCIENVLLKGFLDAPVLIISTSILIVVIDFDYSKYDIKKCLLIAIGIMTLMIFRRHWLYWIVGLIISMSIQFLFQLRENCKQTITNSLLSALTIGVFCGILLLIPFRGFLNHSLRNYASIYVAWNGSLADKINSFVGAFGSLIKLMIVMIPFCIIKNRANIKYILLSLVLIFVPTYLINRSVIMHDSHFYLIVVPIILISVIGFNSIIFILKNKKWNITVGIIFVTYIVVNYLCYGFYDKFNFINNRAFRYVFMQGDHYNTLYRSDLDNIKNMVKEINKLTEEYDTNVYICAGSDNLNQCLLQYAFEPDTFQAIPRWNPSSDVDLRDGFNTSIFDAGIVVVEGPTPDLESNTYQKNIFGVIWFLSEQIRDPNSPIGRHYKLVSEYDLINNSVGSIYVKISDFEASDYDYLISFYDELYPNNKDIFSERIQNYIEEKFKTES